MTSSWFVLKPIFWWVEVHYYFAFVLGLLKVGHAHFFYPAICYLIPPPLADMGRINWIGGFHQTKFSLQNRLIMLWFMIASLFGYFLLINLKMARPQKCIQVLLWVLGKYKLLTNNLRVRRGWLKLNHSKYKKTINMVKLSKTPINLNVINDWIYEIIITM